MSLAKNITFLANGYSLADALKSFSVEADSEEIDSTVLANDFRSYEQGFKSGTLNATGIFDHDPVLLDKIHDVFSAAFADSTDVLITASLGTVTVGEPAVMLTGAEVKYEVPAPLGQLIMSNANFRSKNGINFGRWLMKSQLDAGTTNGTSIDNGAATTNGGVFQAHLQNDDATDVDVKVQHSTNNSTWVDLAGATALNLSDPNAAGSGIVAKGVTINRWLRAVAIVTGGDTILVSAAFARR